MDFYQTPIHKCGYLPNRYSINILADPSVGLTTHHYSSLIDYGFRRNGKHLYRPQCPHCKECVPTRVKVSKFNPNRSQKRTLRTNQDLCLNVIKASYKDEHFQLYKTYLKTRHTESPMALSSANDYKDFIIGGWAETYFLEIRKAKELICVAVFDLLPQGISAVYTFYEPENIKRGLGTFAILKLIEEAHIRGLAYLYLGYWIKDSSKMSYKTLFKPVQGYINKSWQEI